jgi:hypothetical protein
MDTHNGFDGSGVEGRHKARELIGLGVLLALFSGFLFIAAPGYGGGIGTDTWLTSLPLVGLVMPIVGLAWMVVIYRRAFDPEPEQDAWRYRAD